MGYMSEIQPDMLGGKAVPASRLRKGRRTLPPPVRNGWADKPGSGPVGETCASCTYCAEYRFRRTYFKCSARPGEHWKGGRETDIRPLDPACSQWSARIKEARTEPATRPCAPPPQPQPVISAAPKAQLTRKPNDERQVTFPWR